MNKTDLGRRWSPAELQSLNGGGPVVAISAKTGEGLQELVGAVKEFSLGGQSGTGDARWMLNARHQAALRRAQTALQEAIRATQQNAYEECVAMELQTALTALGEIIGETTSEDLLGEIFKNFCVGK
jgi:tRNA modification GTPase